MKKSLFVIIALVAFMMSVNVNTFAQAPYKHAIGGTVGNFEGFSYRTFVTDHFVIGVDLGVKLTPTVFSETERWKSEKWGPYKFSGTIGTLELNPNFMYEHNLVSSLYIFGGGGVSLGYSWAIYGAHADGAYAYGYNWRKDMGKFGLNGIVGLEWCFDFPLDLTFDFRPGYGLAFYGEDYIDYDVHGNESKSRVHCAINYFDWSVNAGVRYKF